MRVTTTGHAGLFIESDETTLLVDPWLAGSCYWRSWWQYPPSPEPDPAWLAPDYLYLTHHHFDHAHYPSLRRIDRDTTVLIPRFGNAVMPGELARLGFRNVVEMPHGSTLRMGPVALTSYQYGFDDSALVVADRDALVVDLNDCKLRPAQLALLRRRFGRPDLMLKSHSWAQGYPHCYSAPDPDQLGLVSRDSYLSDFLDAARALQPRDAVPFASMVCFLHPDTWERNADVVTPLHVADAIRARPVDGTRLIIMNPGHRWDHDVAFRSDPGEVWSDRPAHLERLRRDVAPLVDRATGAEAERTLDAAELVGYMSGFLRSVPRSVSLFLRRPVVLDFGSSDGYCVLDWWRRRARMAPEPPEGYASLIQVPAGILASALADRIVHFVHISMRFRTRLGPAGVGTDFAFWSLLALWELGYLPARRVLTRRFASVAWRRRSEVAGMVRVAATRRGPLVARMTSRLMPELPADTELPSAGTVREVPVDTDA